MLETAKVDIALHLDHGTKFETIKKPLLMVLLQL